MAASSSILLYLLKANGALLVLAALYFGLLRRLTFFALNRAYLLLALLFAALYPALPVPALLPAGATPAVYFPVVGNAVAALPATAPSAPAVDWAAVGVALYGAGTAVLLARLLVQLLALARLRARSRPARVLGQPVRVLPGPLSPFSFGRSIYLNPDQHPGPELAAVLRHEQVHVRQAHTLDVLLAQLALAAAWCNPAAWLLRRALLDNLEYLADAAVLATGLDRRAYQYSLLRLSHAPAGSSLVSHFTFPTLKNRVLMMNSPLSSSGQRARYVVAASLVLAVALGFSGARAQSAAPVANTNAATTRPQTARTTARPLPAGIVAYIAKAYPGSRVGNYSVADRASDKAPYSQYYASVTAADGQNHKLYFDAAEQLAATTTTTATVVQAGRAPGLGNGLSRPAPVVYVDGQRYPGEVNDIDPESIAGIQILKEPQARQVFGAASGPVVLIVTKANQNSATVRALNDRVAKVAPLVPGTETPAEVNVLTPTALAYITKTYPNSRIIGVTKLSYPSTGRTLYKVELAEGRRPHYAFFDEHGTAVQP